jgi:hypothetical protein
MIFGRNDLKWDGGKLRLLSGRLLATVEPDQNNIAGAWCGQPPFPFSRTSKEVLMSQKAMLRDGSETAARSRKSIPIHAQDTKLTLSHIPLFDDWKRFCFVLREIASGENGRPLPSFEAQKRAQAVLTECGYTWPGQTVAPEPNGALDMPSKPENEVKKPARKSERGTR